MARTRSQKARRLAARNAQRQASAKATREAIAHEVHISQSLARSTFIDAIREGKESVHAQRVRTHHKRVTYVALQNDTLGKRTRREALPLVRVQTTTRLDAKRKIAARVLQTYARVAREQGISKRAMLDWFKVERPHDAELLGLLSS